MGRPIYRYDEHVEDKKNAAVQNQFENEWTIFGIELDALTSRQFKQLRVLADIPSHLNLVEYTEQHKRALLDVYKNLWPRLQPSQPAMSNTDSDQQRIGTSEMNQISNDLGREFNHMALGLTTPQFAQVCSLAGIANGVSLNSYTDDQKRLLLETFYTHHESLGHLSSAYYTNSNSTAAERAQALAPWPPAPAPFATHPSSSSGSFNAPVTDWRPYDVDDPSSSLTFGQGPDSSFERDFAEWIQRAEPASTDIIGSI